MHAALSEKLHIHEISCIMHLCKKIRLHAVLIARAHKCLVLFPCKKIRMRNLNACSVKRANYRCMKYHVLHPYKIIRMLVALIERLCVYKMPCAVLMQENVNSCCVK